MVFNFLKIHFYKSKCSHIKPKMNTVSGLLYKQEAPMEPGNMFPNFPIKQVAPMEPGAFIHIYFLIIAIVVVNF